MNGLNNSQEKVQKEIVDYVCQKNGLINNNAIELLKVKTNFKEIIDELLEDNVFMIDEKNVINKLLKQELKTVSVEDSKIVEVFKTNFKPLAKEFDFKPEIISSLDVTGKSLCEGTVEDFHNFFLDKYYSLEKILKRRIDFSPQALISLERMQKNKEFCFVGMVNKKWVSKKGHFILQLEDPEKKVIGVVMKDKQKLFEEANKLLLDNVAGFKASKASNDMVIINEFIWPDVPVREPKTIEEDLMLAVTSDLHVGSNHFLEQSFKKFLAWLNGRVGGEKEKEKAGKIKVLLLVGDNVDGLGIYPNQLPDLNIRGIREQYKALSDLLLEVPEHVHVVMCPGQHDAVRRADPQPAISKRFLPELYEQENFHFTGSPGWIDFQGIKILLYHGASFHDLYSSVNYLKHTEPQGAMQDILRRRDLMPCFGLRQPYVPEKKNYLVIKEEPNIFCTGDMHHNGYAYYKGTLLVNGGTWQSVTSFQEELGHKPTPGILPLISLKNYTINENHFIRSEKSE
ncbi:MAG: metallophosphoesterase [archaeon]